MKKNEITSTVYDIKIDFEKSSGSYVYDKNRGKKFLDFLSFESANTSLIIFWQSSKLPFMAILKILSDCTVVINFR